MIENKMSQHLSKKAKDAFLNIKNKIYLWFLNKFVAKKDEYYGFTEPSEEWMNLNNKKFWIQPCNGSDEEEMK